MLVEEERQKGPKNIYQGNTSSFKDKKIVMTSNAKATNEVNVIKPSRPSRTYLE